MHPLTLPLIPNTDTGLAASPWGRGSLTAFVRKSEGITGDGGGRQ